MTTIFILDTARRALISKYMSSQGPHNDEQSVCIKCGQNRKTLTLWPFSYCKILTECVLRVSDTGSPPTWSVSRACWEQTLNNPYLYHSVCSIMEYRLVGRGYRKLFLGEACGRWVFSAFWPHFIPSVALRHWQISLGIGCLLSGPRIKPISMEIDCCCCFSASPTTVP